jgi:c-di-GMP-binding flagellar brake protein YcgR
VLGEFTGYNIFMGEPQRRKHTRVTVFIPVNIIVNGVRVGKGEVEDISLGGAYVRTTVRVRLGDRVEIEFQFAGMKTVLGTVVEVNEIDASAPVRLTQTALVRWDRNGTGFGIQFASISIEMARLLKKLIKYLGQLQKDIGAL